MTAGRRAAAPVRDRANDAVRLAIGNVVLCCALMLATLPTAAADAVSGTWGPAPAGGAPKCQGGPVLVLDEGRYFRVLPNVGSTGGVNQLILSHSTYQLRGNRLLVAPTLSFRTPQPRQRFTVQRIGGRALVLDGRERVVFKPCPRLDPNRLDAAVKRLEPAPAQTGSRRPDRTKTPSPAGRE